MESYILYMYNRLIYKIAFICTYGQQDSVSITQLYNADLNTEDRQEVLTCMAWLGKYLQIFFFYMGPWNAFF